MATSKAGSPISSKIAGSAMEGRHHALQAVYDMPSRSISGFGSWILPAMTRSGHRAIASGAKPDLLTTGRGSMFGSQPAPDDQAGWHTLRMYRRLQEDMDINCGCRTLRRASIEQMGRSSSTRNPARCPGERNQSELLGLGTIEFIPWHLGVVS